MMKKFPYNPLKRTSASSLSGFINQYLSKVITSLPTQAEFVDIFERTLIGWFSCVNTRLAFESKIIFLKEDARKRKEIFKLIYKIRNSELNIYEGKRLATK